MFGPVSDWTTTTAVTKLLCRLHVHPVMTHRLGPDATPDRRSERATRCPPYCRVILVASEAHLLWLCQKYTLRFIVELTNPIKLSALLWPRLADETLHLIRFLKANWALSEICFGSRAKGTPENNTRHVSVVNQSTGTEEIKAAPLTSDNYTITHKAALFTKISDV